LRGAAFGVGVFRLTAAGFMRFDHEIVSLYTLDTDGGIHLSVLKTSDENITRFSADALSLRICHRFAASRLSLHRQAVKVIMHKKLPVCASSDLSHRRSH